MRVISGSRVTAPASNALPHNAASSMFSEMLTKPIMLRPRYLPAAHRTRDIHRAQDAAWRARAAPSATRPTSIFRLIASANGMVEGHCRRSLADVAPSRGCIDFTDDFSMIVYRQRRRNIFVRAASAPCHCCAMPARAASARHFRYYSPARVLMLWARRHAW